MSPHKPTIATLVCCSYLIFFTSFALTQDQALPPEQGIPASALTTKSVHAVGYEVGTGSTKVDMKATELMPQATGEA
jgi:hypothetical protein